MLQASEKESVFFNKLTALIIFNFVIGTSLHWIIIWIEMYKSA